VGSESGVGDDEVTGAVLARYGTTYADEAGIQLADEPAPLFQLLVLQEVKGIGPTGAAVFLREVQAVWPWVRPFLDGRARDGARRLGLPDHATALAGLVDGGDLTRFAAALVRVARLPGSRDPLSG
jgi:hypothetical protein